MATSKHNLKSPEPGATPPKPPRAPRSPAKPAGTAKPAATAKPPATAKPAATAKPPADLPPASTIQPTLLVGRPAPELDLESDLGGRVRLADLAGKKIVLYFYPKDDAPGCTLEANDFHAARPAFARKNAVVVGVSRDSLAAHARFRAKHGLGFVLLSDPDARVLRAYGVWAEKVLYGKRSLGIVRSTFVIGEDGKVIAAFPKVKVAGHVDEVLAVLS